MGKIAAQLDDALRERHAAGAHGALAARPLAAGDGWSVMDMLCTFGPHDPAFGERHDDVCIAAVVAGSFAYRGAAGSTLLTPGALLLGNDGACFECGHRHGAGDRCVSFHYQPEYFESLAADAGVTRGTPRFARASIAPLRALSPLIADACAGLAAGVSLAWDELAVELAVAALRAAGENPRAHQREGTPGTAAWSRVAQAVRLIERAPEAPHTLHTLAQACGLSDFHFLRTFERVAGVTPYQYVLRARLRHAALQLADYDGTRETIVNIAFGCGFNDLSNFNHAFRAEFAMSPRIWRARHARTPAGAQRG
ncbi:helix-turn-helix transcriptional regulator [Paraburkholderia humisilvae]|uniref:HTH-type transcriptional activator RhaS n=1 Tax=Paraburkholderia humisilvae TaxID=627669 RepID=A0A6J5EMD7_9BURK|nr:AraC family transcriptional regulator [Paraburkholderia humisilvae]CAB3767730.1 HTH-type transcriptional activator RhaS [Paraburkholderia humisilvae]